MMKRTILPLLQARASILQTSPMIRHTLRVLDISSNHTLLPEPILRPDIHLCQATLLSLENPMEGTPMGVFELRRHPMPIYDLERLGTGPRSISSRRATLRRCPAPWAVLSAEHLVLSNLSAARPGV